MSASRDPVLPSIADDRDSFYIDRMAGISGGKRVLVVLFVPSVERDGATAIDQDRWVNAAL